jgi:hypothetical protein
MVPEFRLPEEGSQRSCSWCGDVLGESLLPPEVAALFCSRRCEIEANFWLYQEMCAIEISHPWPRQEGCDSP